MTQHAAPHCRPQRSAIGDSRSSITQPAGQTYFSIIANLPFCPSDLRAGRLAASGETYRRFIFDARAGNCRGRHTRAMVRNFGRRISRRANGSHAGESAQCQPRPAVRFPSKQRTLAAPILGLPGFQIQ